MSVTYNTDTKSTAFTAHSGDYLYLMSMLADQVNSTFGVTLPFFEPSATPNTAATTTAVSMVFGNGLEQLSVGLGGTWTISKIASSIGLSWPLEDDLFSISAPSVVYTSLPTSFGVTMAVDIPALGVSKMTSSLLVQSNAAFSLQVRQRRNIRG